MKTATEEWNDLLPLMNGSIIQPVRGDRPLCFIHAMNNGYRRLSERKWRREWKKVEIALGKIEDDRYIDDENGPDRMASAVCRHGKFICR